MLLNESVECIHTCIMYITSNMYKNVKICNIYYNDLRNCSQGLTTCIVSEEPCLIMGATNSRGCGMHMIWNIQFIWIKLKF